MAYFDSGVAKYIIGQATVTVYFGKGRMIAIAGKLRKRTYYDKNGTKHYVTEVYVDSASFTGEPKQGGSSNSGYSNNYNNLPAQNSNQNNTTVSIGDRSDFEETLTDDGVPF